MPKNLPVPIHTDIVKDGKPTTALVRYLQDMQNRITALEEGVYGSLMIIGNTTPEPIVDSTFRKINTFNVLGQYNKVTGSIVTNEIIIPSTSKYLFIGTAKLDSNGKTFELHMFVNGEDTGFGMSDRSDGNAAISTTVKLKSGDVITAYQRSTNGGVSLTIETMTLTLVRVG